MKNKVLYIAIAAAAAILLLLLGILLFWDPILDALPIDQSGWQEEDDVVFYLDEKGDPLTGWQTIDGSCYYFADSDGHLLTGWQDLEDGRYYLGTDGVRSTGWLETDEGRFYLADSGAMVTGWQDLPEGRFFFNENGNPHTGWLEVEEGRFYMHTDGTAATGWQEIDGSSYYFTETENLMLTGWQEIEGSRYYLGTDGMMNIGWQEIDGVRYYFDINGVLATGWQEIDSLRYYFNEDGSVYSGLLESEEGVYYINEDGSMHTGWMERDGFDYYFTEDGTAAQGRVEVEGETLYFSSRGMHILLVNRWNPLPDDYVPEELVTSQYGATMTPEAAAALDLMLADCIADGFDPYLRTSYRDFAFQRALLDNKIGEGYTYDQAIQIVAIPGTSEHHTGLSIDLVEDSYRNMNYQQENQPTQQWLMEHCWEYGFIVRYPVGSTDITGIIYEPWHYRYVGVELAAELHELGIPLEEYLDMLTNDGTTCGDPASLE